MTNEELLKEIIELKKEVQELKGIKKKTVPEISTYSFSKITDAILKKLVNIEKIYEQESIFEEWFNFNYKIKDDVTEFLQKLIDKNGQLIFDYHEEDLKANFIVPLINKVDFFMMKAKIRNFYNEPLNYKTEKFIFNGRADLMVSSGLQVAIKPYFFIQEFKKSEEFGNPRPQLLAEMISAVELNNWSEIKGTYIIGESWRFVILEKLGKDKYQYFISKVFNSTNIDDLKGIYRNLQFVKNEIIQMVRQEKQISARGN